MAINPPSDIVNDVARAADPTRYQAAAQRLLEGAPADGVSFDGVVKALSGQPLMASGADVYTLRNSLRNDAEALGATKAKKAHQDFEAYVLQTFIESMLPKDAENAYGKGNAGSIWKSMLAEQMSTQISKSGGIGIAKYLNAHKAEITADRAVPPAAPPYIGHLPANRT